jgi:N-acetylated-alpha-linked acidic dipeptidase
LRKAINNLQSASAILDDEKEKAEKSFKDLLHKLPKKHVSCRHFYVRPVVDWIMKLFGIHPCHKQEHGHRNCKAGYCMDVFDKAEIGLADMHKSQSPVHPHHGPPGCLIRKLIKAAKRVRKANQRLIAFERGFISKEGIRNREWYKHLGVAPGLWLGQSS